MNLFLDVLVLWRSFVSRRWWALMFCTAGLNQRRFIAAAAGCWRSWARMCKLVIVGCRPIARCLLSLSTIRGVAAVQQPGYVTYVGCASRRIRLSESDRLDRLGEATKYDLKKIGRSKWQQVYNKCSVAAYTCWTDGFSKNVLLNL